MNEFKKEGPEFKTTGIIKTKKLENLIDVYELEVFFDSGSLRHILKPNEVLRWIEMYNFWIRALHKNRGQCCSLEYEELFDLLSDYKDVFYDEELDSDCLQDLFPTDKKSGGYYVDKPDGFKLTYYDEDGNIFECKPE